MNTSENADEPVSRNSPSQSDSDHQPAFVEERNNDRPVDESETCSSSESSDGCVDEVGLPLNSNFSRLEANASSAHQPRGCRHYSRGCQLRSPCCNLYFWCRHCHNEAMDTGDPKTAHQLDRFAVKTLRCGKCDLEQLVQKNCEGCGQLFGEYFCPICKFFDDDLSKGVFHCDGCGICRVGGRENFFHCAACGCCYAVQLRSNHKCIAGAMHHNCPVCLENLFHSTSQVRVLRCGHTLHKKCLEQLLRRPTTVRTCPLCSKTIVDHQLTWQQVRILPMHSEGLALPREESTLDPTRPGQGFFVCHGGETRGARAPQTMQPDPCMPNPSQPRSLHSYLMSFPFVKWLAVRPGRAIRSAQLSRSCVPCLSSAPPPPNCCASAQPALPEAMPAASVALTRKCDAGDAV
jgi:RING finger/CHY zinc finger protein 1